MESELSSQIGEAFTKALDGSFESGRTNLEVIQLDVDLVENIDAQLRLRRELTSSLLTLAYMKEQNLDICLELIERWEQLGYDDIYDKVRGWSIIVRRCAELEEFDRADQYLKQLRLHIASSGDDDECDLLLDVDELQAGLDEDRKEKG